MAKLIIKQPDKQNQFAPLVTNPIKTSEISDFKNDVDSISQALPVEKPGTLTIDNVTYTAYNSQELQVDVPKSSKHIYSTDVEVSDKSSTNTTTTVTVDPLQFSDSERMSLVEILKVLAKASHTHSMTEGGTVTDSKTFDITPTIPPGATVMEDPGWPNPIKACRSYCKHCNNDCTNNGKW